LPDAGANDCVDKCFDYANNFEDNKSSYVDLNVLCPDWASWSPSECEVNSDYMLVNCQKSCEAYLDQDNDTKSPDFSY
jgi:hypothetical protein